MDAISELVKKIKSHEIKNKKQLELEKIAVSKKYSLGKVLKNADILTALDKKDYKKYQKLLSIKPVRTGSGVANISVMWLPSNPKTSCPFNCVYCPQGLNKNKNVPKSYTGTEPTTMRAMRHKFDPYQQTKNRLWQFSIIGHPTDKCELIIMGGTYTSWKREEQEKFIKRCLDAMNNKNSVSLKEAIKLNETASNRCVGLTIETRADCINEKEINHMLDMGCTRVELGVQTTSDDILKKINRGHDTQKNKEAIKLLKKAGLKVCVHWMPGLTGFNRIDIKKEVLLFKKLFDDPDYRPDELKIYPTLVIEGTSLYKMWKQGEYEALTKERMIELLIKLKKEIPTYVRVKRIMRDISEKEVGAGAATTNLRQIVHEKGKICRCIRCREIGSKDVELKKPELLVKKYEASGGMEVFLSYEDVKNDLIFGFLRLRIDDDVARIRELHVYGKMTEIGKKGKNVQHKGLGKKLLEKAEEIAKNNKCKKIHVTSGIGVREYYKKLGYKLEGNYMVKKLV